MSHAADSDFIVRKFDHTFMLRVLAVLAVLALISAGILLAGKLYGRIIALGGHTDDTTINEIIIGNNVLRVPSNMLRHERQRMGGVQGRIELYSHWPDMSGFTRAQSDDFNHMNDSRNIIFLTFEEQMMSRDMSGRVDPIYGHVTVKPGIPGPAGLTMSGFTPQSGYLDELLVTAPRSGDTPYAARCLAGDQAKNSLAPCERDIHVGDNLSLTYRFSKDLLGDWRQMDASVLAIANKLLQIAK